MITPPKSSITLSLLRFIPFAASFTLIVANTVKVVEILSGFHRENVDHKQLTVLAGIVVGLDILFFLLMQGAGLRLDFIHIASYLLACNLGYLVTAATTTKPLSYFGPSALLRYHAVLLPVLFLRCGIVAFISTWYPGKGLLVPLPVACYSMLASTIGYLIVTSKINCKIQPLNWRLTFLLIIFNIVLLYALIKPQWPAPPKPDLRAGGTQAGEM